MTYSIADLEAAIEDETTPWEGDWGEFDDEITKKVDYPDCDSTDPDAIEMSWDKGRFYKRVPRERVGVDLPGIGFATHVDGFGGMDQGSDYYFVFTITDAEGGVRTFKRDGWYQSHDGGYYEGPTTEVKPVEKTITVWEDI
jgi:hypothetical protein